MKKVFLFVFFILSFLCVKSQEYSETIVYSGWEVENEGNWGSFWWKVDRTATKYVDGYYYYYMYFYSNSFFDTRNQDGTHYDKAMTYIEYPVVSMDEYISLKGIYNTVESELKYIMVDWASEYKFYFYSQDPSPSFDVTYNSVYPYDYSKIK